MRIFLILLLLITSLSVHAQTSTRLILHLQSADTLVHRSLVNQISNMKKEIPDAEIAVICHGPGMDLLLKNKSKYIDRIANMEYEQLQFIGCEFTMKQRNIKSEDLVPYATTVPYALVDIVKRQNEGWLYVKLGF